MKGLKNTSTTYMNKYWFLGLGVLLQVVTYILTQDSFLSFISGLSGVISVVLCSQRKMGFYFFGFVQLFTYIVLCLEQRLYAEIAENGFYFITMLYGLFHWLKHYNSEVKEVKTRKLSVTHNVCIGLMCIIGILFLYVFLIMTDDAQPFMDAVTTVPAFIAQILMILRYRESWYYWLIIDVGSIIMWSFVGNWIMVVQFMFWTINCAYGLYKWSEFS